MHHGEVALPLIYLHIFHDIRGQCLQGQHGVFAREVHTIDEDTLHLAAIMVEHAIAETHAGQPLEGIAQQGTLLHGKGIEVVDGGVVLRHKEQARGMYSDIIKSIGADAVGSRRLLRVKV